MPTYKYTATDDNGKKHKGTMDAADEAELQQRLKRDGRYLIKSKSTSDRAPKRLKSTELADFSRELGSLLGAGVSLARALGIISEQEGIKPRLREVYTELNRSVRLGTPLSEAMEAQGCFPPLMVYMYRASEASGSLARTAMQMAEHYTKDHKLNSKIKSSLMYPKLLSVIMVAAVVIIMTFVMPKFDELFSQMPQLPLATRILFGLSDLVRYHWKALLLVIFGVVVLFKLIKRIPAVRMEIDRVKLKLPVVGKLLRVIYTARFARTLSSLYACGISLVSALQIARSVIGNRYIEAQFDSLITSVRTGNSLSDGLSSVDGFTKKLAFTVRIGEESGSLENLLLNIADSLDHDAEMSMERLVQLVEPAMIIIMALMVVFLMFAVIMPIYDSMSTLG